MTTYEEGRATAHETGMKNRRAVLGDAHVDASIEKMTPVRQWTVRREAGKQSR